MLMIALINLYKNMKMQFTSLLMICLKLITVIKSKKDTLR